MTIEPRPGDFWHGFPSAGGWIAMVLAVFDRGVRLESHHYNYQEDVVAFRCHYRLVFRPGTVTVYRRGVRLDKRCGP